jgi:hypothetical protein
LGQEFLRLRARPLEFLVLHLQFDLVDPEFVDESLIGTGSLLSRFQPFFGDAPQGGGI